MKKLVLTLTSYPPRACGIATYSQDLLRALKQKFGGQFNFKVCALENGVSNLRYPPEVVQVLDATKAESFARLAEDINLNPEVMAVHIQHEFGLFGGAYGAHLLHLLTTLKKPAFVTFHTVLPNPDDTRRHIVKTICATTVKTHVMTKRAAELLICDYQIPADRIEVIPHGTHVVSAEQKSTAKQQSQFANRLLLTTFGLLNANKSIETALRALPAIRAHFPEVLYLVLGKTHPEVVKQEGETYRSFLEAEVARLGLQDNVLFVDKYLELQELLDYLKMTDLYLFTSKDPNQATSGTFVYALSSGCPVVATRIPHTEEYLDEHTGRLIDFENPEQLAEATIELFSNKELMQTMRRGTYAKMRHTIWENVAIATAKMYEACLPDKKGLSFDLPEIRLDHLRHMTTEIGIIQFADASTPDPASGYTLDDNARALIAVVKHFALTRDRKDIALLDTYLRFVQDCQLENGRWSNYRDISGQFSEQNNRVNLDDANGRTAWALGEMVAQEAILPTFLVKSAKNGLRNALPQLREMRSPRAIAFAIKGLYYYNTVQKDPQIPPLIELLAGRLVAGYEANAAGNWRWFEAYLTYANSVLPEALLYTYLATNRPIYKTVAKTSFQFLLSLLFDNNQMRVISNDGWLHKEGIPGDFGEQPIDVCYTIEALDIFYQVFGEPDYRKKMNIAFSWFSGNNRLNQIMYNPANGACCDGLERHGVNLNQGAESTVCYLIARLTLEHRLREELLLAYKEEKSNLIEFKHEPKSVIIGKGSPQMLAGRYRRESSTN